uniref:Uncharacterized protein n=1 Tax=Scophthalmus maximus TaxID=52904 RepID=A0A8D3CCE2_SCOMX
MASNRERLNTGALSLASRTVTRTVAVPLFRGVPPSRAVSCNLISCCSSRSNSLSNTSSRIKLSFFCRLYL